MNMASFLGTDRIAKSNFQLGNDILRANREFGETLRNISEAEIESKDRVDITLKEYESMKYKIESLQKQNRMLTNILERIEVPLDKEIIPDSIRTCWCDIPFEFKRRYRIEFDIDYYNLRD